MRSREPGAVRDRPAPVGTSEPEQHPMEWSWPPYAPIEATGALFDTPDWAPASSVWHPLLRVGRWTVLYRRAS